MIPEIEKEIFNKISYADKLLKIKSKYSRNNQDSPIFGRETVRSAFEKLSVPYKCKGNNYIISKDFKKLNSSNKCNF